MKNNWKTLTEFVKISSPWLTLIGEKIEDNQGNILDYWRIEKDHSVIIITRQGNKFIFPVPVFRPGVAQVTLDFPGGRVSKSQTPKQAGLSILKRELDIDESQLDSLTPINNRGWEINSSFSNQKLYGFSAIIKENISLNSNLIGCYYNCNEQGINQLLNDLTCLQCRALLLEYLKSIFL
jgi:hypothetical protein